MWQYAVHTADSLSLILIVGLETHKFTIIFKNGIFGLILSLCVVKLFYTVNFLFYILQIIAFTLEFMYCSGMVIVHYNILLDDENILESALENYSKDGKNMDNQKKMTNYPPPYSQIV